MRNEFVTRELKVTILEEITIIENNKRNFYYDINLLNKRKNLKHAIEILGKQGKRLNIKINEIIKLLSKDYFNEILESTVNRVWKTNIKRAEYLEGLKVI